MSTVIRFLEAQGATPGFNPASAQAYADAVATPAVDEAQRQALQARDATALNALVSGRDSMHCLVMPYEQTETH